VWKVPVVDRLLHENAVARFVRLDRLEVAGVAFAHHLVKRRGRLWTTFGPDQLDGTSDPPVVADLPYVRDVFLVPVGADPVWLDEAIEGVDALNRSTMLDLFVDFDLDFLLAGPGTVVASAQVPSAALWHVHKAPGADPGVSLSLMLWAGKTLTPVTTPPLSWHEPKTNSGVDDTEDTLWT